MTTVCENRGGKIKSPKYLGSHARLLFECSDGHTWKTSPTHIKSGQWCPYCAGKNKTIEDMKDLALQRGGICLSSRYRSNKHKLKWRCSEGHEWYTAPSNIESGNWCPECGLVKRAYSRRRHTIEEMKRLAENRGGRCLSKEFTNIHKKLRWKCKDGHVWEATPANIMNGKWCRICGIERRAEASRLTIEDMRIIAKKNGGRCLSGEYRNALSKLKWQCVHGHTWEAVPNSVRRGTWCPVCSGRVKLTMKEMHKRARSRGGRCLSKRYVNARTKLRWRCSNGHIFRMTPDSVKSGQWCPVCARAKRKKKVAKK